MDRSSMTLAEALGNAGGLNQIMADATRNFCHSFAAEKRAFRKKLPASPAQCSGRSMVLGTGFSLSPKDIVYVTALHHCPAGIA